MAFDRNNLDKETSPYLLQHQDNPVHWQPWSQEVLDAAQAADKPILLSIGYAACHWCHVMAHESFEDPETAKVMNDLFVNIKVDREERPDIDAIYMNALHLLGEQGGWPLTMFLTPKGEPVWGGTYFPNKPSYGRPGFTHVLERVHDIFVNQKETIEQNRTALVDALHKMSATDDPLALSPEILDRIADKTEDMIDRQYGGVKGAPKFPQTGLLSLLWRSYLRTGKESLRDAVITSLDQMCQGGIYDHLGGGFARYSVDDRWLVPHFEKMLYDNALLIDLMCSVWQETRSPLYQQRIEETIEWTIREMTETSGGFAASLDADSEGVEGKYYVWTAGEIDALLGEDASDFKHAYDVERGGNWEGHSILNRSHHLSLYGPEEEIKLKVLRQLLWEEREKRVRPGWDDKVLVDWNGLMIGAMARASALFDKPTWREAAVHAFDAVTSNMTYETDGTARLHHSYRVGQAKHHAMADGYANMAWAALRLWEITSDSNYVGWADKWSDALSTYFWDPQSGGFYYTASDAEALISRTKTAADNAIPNANGTMIEVLTKLASITGRTARHMQAKKLIDAFSGEMQKNFFPLMTYLNGFDFHLNATEIVIKGEPDDVRTRSMIDAALNASRPNLILSVIPPALPLPEGHAATDKPQIDGVPTAYVCRNQTCSPPCTSADQLMERLSE